jgi:hypothetical protein
MSLSVIISIQDSGTAMLRRLGVTVASPELRRAMGRGLANRVKDKFIELQSSRPNKRNWPRQNYWAQAARSVSQPKLQGDAITVSIAQPGLAARYLGPTEIKPVAHKFLAIPARAEAYGTRPIDARWTGKLKFAVLPRGGPVLLLAANIMRVVKSGARKGREVFAGKNQPATSGEGGVMFWLRRKITMPQDKSVLPTEAEMQAAAVAAGNAYVNAQLAKGGAP